MFWDTFRADLRFAIRQALAAPLYTTLAIAALALGIGATTSVLTVVNGVLVRDLPYEAPDRLVMVWSDNRNEGRPLNPVSGANFTDFRTMNRTLESVDYLLSFIVALAVGGDEAGGRAWALRTGDTLFDVLGRAPMLGRVYRSGDRNVAVVSHGFWQRHLGSDPAAIGRRLTFSGNETLEIIGVMPPDFVFPYRSMFGPWASGQSTAADLWIPMPLEGPRWVDGSGQLVRNVHALIAIGRLKPGVTAANVRDDLNEISRQLEARYPASNRNWGATIVPLDEQTTGGIRPAMLLLLAGVGLILLMAAVNVTNLILARAVGRQRERAVRAALGAGRGRLARQALTEGLLLSIAGGVVGTLGAHWGVRALVAIAPIEIPRIREVTPDATVLVVTIIVSLVTGTLIGLLPAVAAARQDVRGALQDHARGTTSARGGRRVRDGLLVAEVALAVLLTVAGGLLLHSFVRLMRVDPGFSADSLLTFQMDVPARLNGADARRAFYEEVLDRLERLPEVVAVGGTTRIPLGSTSVTTSLQVDGPSPVGPLPEPEFRRSMRNYFEAMQIPVLRGRAFTPGDGLGDEPVAVVNQQLARRLFGDSDPLGRRVRMGPDSSSPWITIVGVVGDIRHTNLETPPLPELYVNYASNPPNSPFLAIRTSGSPAVLGEIVRRELRAVDPSLAPFDMRTMTDRRADSVASRRFVMVIVGACTLLALLLAAVGVYGVVALVVAHRVPEMGVRLALGAHPRSVQRLVIGHALARAAAGVATGMGAAALLAPLLRSQLFGVTAADPWTFIASPVVLIVVAVVAALVPAGRAMRIDPVAALRQ